MYKLILLSISLLVGIKVDLWSQPAKSGCHILHQHIPMRPLTPEEVKQNNASIERSDSMDIIDQSIQLDLRQFSQKQIYGVCTSIVEVKIDSVSSIILDLLDLEIDSVYSTVGSLNYERHHFSLKIELDRVYYKGERFSVSVEYHGTPTTSQGTFGGFYFEGAYAYNLGIDIMGMPHNFGRSWYPCFDNFVERSTYTIQITSNGGRKGYAVGLLVDEIEPEPDVYQRTYRLEEPIPSYLVGVAISEYDEYNYTHTGLEEELQVQIIAAPQDLTEAKSSLSLLPDALDCLEYWYGPYIWHRVGYVMTPRGAMEHSCNIAYPVFTIDGGVLSTRLMTHELCHHWWGNMVSPNYAADMWIKEGNAEYGAHLIEEYIGGKEAFRTAVRNNHYNFITDGVTQDGGYIAMSPLSHENTYGEHTYYKGASMIHNMRQYLGDSLFRYGQTQILKQNLYGVLNAQTYRDELTRITGVDMHSYFDDWIFSPGYADHFVHHVSYADLIGQLAIAIGQNSYHTNKIHENTPVPLTLFFEDGTKMDTSLLVSGSLDTAYIMPIAKPITIAVNQGHRMNLAMFESTVTFDQVSEHKDAYSDFILNVASPDSNREVVIEHHLTPPGGIVDESRYQLSDKHFWHVSGNYIDKGNNQLRFFVDKTDKLAPDNDLINRVEDSLVLLYRTDATEEWLPHPDYTMLKLLPNDGRATMSIHSLLYGDYAFAKKLDFGTQTYTPQAPSPEVLLYPNPTSDRLHVQCTDEISSFILYDQSGRKILQLDGTFIQDKHEIIMSDWIPGHYFMECVPANPNHQKTVETFIISR